LILALLRYRTKTEAAEAAGVRRSVMYRWLDGHFTSP